MNYKAIRYISTSVAACVAVTLSGCFTGIESTPKITSKDVKRESIPVKAESTYLADIKPEPFKLWKSGKGFYVSDNKFASILQPVTGMENLDLSGTNISFDSFNIVRDITGNEIIDIHFRTAGGKEIVYRSNRTPESVDDSNSMRIPFLVDVSLVEAVKERMIGNTYYVLTSSWFDNKNQSFTGRKFIPVKVTDVLPGNSFYSTIVCLQDDKGKDFRLFQSVGDDLKSLRQFDSLFSLKNPRDSYPLITDENWKIICDGKVAAGMSKNECRLALGSPKTVNEQFGYSVIREIWSYETGIYLIFEDGALRSFRQ